jgi:hypothetical protein
VGGVVHGVAGDNQGRPLPGQGGEVFPEGDPQLGVEADGGFVEEEQGWIVDDGAGQAGPLLHAAAQVAYALFALPPQIDQLDYLFNPLPSLLSVPQPVDAGEELHVLDYRKLGVE